MGSFVCRKNNTFLSVLNSNQVDNKVITTIEDKDLSAKDVRHIRSQLELFRNRWNVYYNTEDKNSMYYKFKIPKASGGWRQITAPNPGPATMFTDFQNMLSTYFTGKNDYALNHENAYAYIKYRWCKPAVEKHKINESEYFAHFDIHDFFGKTNFEFAISQLRLVYPFSEFINFSENHERLFREVFSICFLNDGLPQGTQVSPMLTNIIMIPFDYHLEERIKRLESDYVVTRYADDIIISSKHSFEVSEFERIIEEVFNQIGASYNLNLDKTSYRRNKGRSNFILGCQLNQDNNITIGRKRKKEIRYLLHNYFNHPESYNVEDKQSMLGKLNYFMCIEPEVYRLTMEYYNRKYHCDVIKRIRQDLSNG